MILTCLTGTTGHCRPRAVRGLCALTPVLRGLCAPAPAYAAARLRGCRPTRLPAYAAAGLRGCRPTRLPAYAAAGRQAASAATPAPREQAGTDGRINGCRNPYQGHRDPRRCDLAADQIGRLIADASMLAAWAAALTSEWPSVTLAPLVPDRTTTPYAAGTGQMTRRSSPIASPGTISGSRLAGPTKTRILVTNPKGEN